MGLSKANELLLLGRKIDAETAVSWNICSEIIPRCDRGGDPFHPTSLASRVAQRLDECLLALPLGNKTAKVSDRTTCRESKKCDAADCCNASCA